MKIFADSSPFIKKNTDTVDTAARRKSGKTLTDTLSSQSKRKFAFIANRDYTCGLGAAFTGKHVPVPPRENAYAQLKLESLRNDLTMLRGQLMAGSCIHRYLGEVLQRLPVPPPLTRDSWHLTPNPSPKLNCASVRFAPDSRMMDGGARVPRIADSEFVEPTAEQTLSCFVEEVQSSLNEIAEAKRAGGIVVPALFSRSDMLQFWSAALAIDEIVDAMATMPGGLELLNRAESALQHNAAHRSVRAGADGSNEERTVPVPPVVPSAAELRRVIDLSGWRSI